MPVTACSVPRSTVAAFHLVSVRIKTPYYAAAITGNGYVGPATTRWSRLLAAIKCTRPQPRILGAWCGSFIVAMILLQVSARAFLVFIA